MPRPAADLLAAMFEQIPPRPPTELDPVLDAVERCLARYGLRRTSMTDISRELGVARTTLYRQVSSLEHGIALVSSRFLFNLLDDVTDLVADGAEVETFVEAAVRIVRFARASPVASRVLNDEPEIVGGVITGGRLPMYVDQVVDVLAPVLGAAMTSGTIRAGDSRLMAALIVRLIGILILAPPGDDLEALARLALEPLLRPDHAEASA